MGRLRALSLALDAVIFAFLVDAPALVATGVAFLFFPDARLVEIGGFAFILFLLVFLARDVRGGFSRKWLGFKIEDEQGRPPGWTRSFLRNLPLVVPGWNVWEAVFVLRHGDRPRPVDRLLGLRFREMP